MHASAEAGRSELVLQLWSKAKAGLIKGAFSSVGNALVEQAVRHGDLRLAMQLHCQGAPVDAYELVITAASAGRLDAMQRAVQLLREEQAGEAAAAAGMAAGGGGEQQQQHQQGTGPRRQRRQGTPGQRTEDSRPAGRCRGPRRALLRTQRPLRSKTPNSSSWSRRASPAALSWRSGCTRGACPWAVTPCAPHAAQSGHEVLVERMVEQGYELMKVGSVTEARCSLYEAGSWGKLWYSGSVAAATLAAP